MKTKISKIEKSVDSIGLPKKGRFGKLSRKAIILGVAVVLVMSVIVSAGLLSYYGKITTTANVEHQAVEVGVGPAGSIVWHPYNDPITHTIPHKSPGGETFCFKQWVRNRASIPVDVTFERIDGWTDEVATKIYAPSPTTTLILENKDSNWDVIADTTQATITFDTVSPTFNYDLTATGLVASTDYTIIYYADRDPRFSLWGGDNPGAVIDTFTTDASGDKTQSNSVNLGMNLPAIPDWNINPGVTYQGTPDNYVHWKGGAKIWIVPTSDLTGGNLPVQNWNPTGFLFETDLIIYFDCNEPVNDYFCRILGEELTGHVTVLSGQKIPILICYTFDLHIGIGTYNLITTVDAEEHT